MQSLQKAFLHSTSKMGQFKTTKFHHFMIIGQLRYVNTYFVILYASLVKMDQRLEFVFCMKTDLSTLFEYFK